MKKNVSLFGGGRPSTNQTAGLEIWILYSLPLHHVQEMPMRRCRTGTFLDIVTPTWTNTDGPLTEGFVAQTVKGKFVRPLGIWNSDLTLGFRTSDLTRAKRIYITNYNWLRSYCMIGGKVVTFRPSSLSGNFQYHLFFLYSGSLNFGGVNWKLRSWRSFSTPHQKKH